MNVTSAAVAELLEQARTLAIEFDAAAAHQFEVYIDTLLFWAQRLSLTGAETARTVALDHILDSLHLAPFVLRDTRLADLGSGAGFPAIPLAIARPSASIGMIESRRKRANFLREVVRQCALKNAAVHEGRAEALLTEATGSFDVVTSRAFSALGDFLGLAAPLLRRGGLALAMKGPAVAAEVNQVSDDFESPVLHPYTLPNGRTLCLVIARRR